MQRTTLGPRVREGDAAFLSGCGFTKIIPTHSPTPIPGDAQIKQGRAKPNAQAALLIRLVKRYPDTVKRLGREPNHPYSGQFRLRLPPELHARAAMVAEAQHKSLNAWVQDVIEKGVATV